MISWIWFVLANLLSLAAVCPFVGSLSDLMGRRYVALLGASFLILGMIVCSTAKIMNVFIGENLLVVKQYHSLMDLNRWYGSSWDWCWDQ